jgi:hypothetical protein
MPYYYIKVQGQIRCEKADDPREACRLAFGIIYDQPQHDTAVYKDIGTRKPAYLSQTRLAELKGPNGWLKIPTAEEWIQGSTRKIDDNPVAGTKSKQYVIRVVIGDDDTPPLATRLEGPFLECLRYAGLVRVHEGDGRQCFDLRAPAGVSNTKQWAESNAQRMATFGFNAVCAPATE